MINKIISCILLTILSSQSFAAANVSTMPAINTDQQIIKVFVVMCTFVIVILLAGLLLKRLMTQLGIKTDKLKVIASIPLGTREKIVLLQVGEKQYLIGATSYSIRTLCEINDEIIELDEKKANINFDKILKQVKAK